MEWFAAPDYWIGRLVIERGLGLIYLLAFLQALYEFPALLGERGLMPVPNYLRFAGFREAPSLFQFRYSDRLLRVVAVTGALLAAGVVVGLPQQAPLPVTMLVWFLLWALYLSIVNVGQRFYAFGWESLLLEAGFLAIFLGNDRTPPPLPVLLLFRWLTFRVEFGAGLIKLRGDQCWRDLTCMYYHHETQPMPNPLSWYFHQVPKPVHRMEVAGNFVAQLAAPVMICLPQPIAGVGAVIMIVTQGFLIVSGNYAWLNLITMVIAASALPDSFAHALVPGAAAPSPGSTAPLWFVTLVLGLVLFVLVLSYRPALNLVSRGQLMNYSFNRYHLVNTYGAFGSVTRVRREVVVEGTDEAVLNATTQWREYEFRGKPGNVKRRPPQVAPFHLRLDWLMWFAALRAGYAEDWFIPLMVKLLEGDRATLRLLRWNPFGDAPPEWVRARFYHYRFTTPRERRETGQWWVRELEGEYARPMRLARPAQEAAA
ncbi:MAG TPA: lipase maturation factor family protein [Gemmatimonadales bacterium]|nr:lipase maturation factor family protein [Gemmatimonadales bacterium]